MEREYIAFISYSHAPLDTAAAAWLRSAIENYVIPANLRKNGKKLGRVFRDRDEMGAAGDLNEKIRSALDRSRYLIVLCSERSKQSRWVEKEIEYFLQHHGKEQVLTVWIQGELEQVRPEALPAEPLAVDVHADGRLRLLFNLEREKLRLFSALLGCEYDDMALRHKRRQYRRRTALFAGVTLAVSVFAGVVISKNRELEQQQRELQARQAELLVQSAQQSLKDGDPAAAMEYALEALPDDSAPDRPYYAPAEAALISALGVVDGGRGLQHIRQEFSLDAYPYAWCISGDGTRLAALDEYSILYCFDVGTGELLWKKDGLYDGYPEEMELRWAGADILVLNDVRIVSIRSEDGEIRWFTGSVYGDLCQFSADGQSIYCLGQPDENEQSQERIDLVRLSVLTGEVEERWIGAELPADEEDTSAHYARGNFSVLIPDAGRRLYITGYNVRDSEENNTWEYRVMDFTDGTIRYWNIGPNPGGNYEVYAMLPTEEDAAVITLREGPDERTACVIEKFDPATGELLWQMQTPEEEDGDFLYGYYGTGLQENGMLIAVRQSFLYVIDTDTGALIDSARVQEPVTALWAVEPGGYGYVLQDGTCSRIRLQEDGSLLIPDPAEDGVVLEHNQTSDVWNGGVLPPKDGGGYVLTVPADGPNQITVHRFAQWPDLSGEQVIYTLREGERVVGVRKQDDGHYQLTIFTEKRGWYEVVDDAGEPVPDALCIDGLLYLPDRSGYLTGFFNNNTYYGGPEKRDPAELTYHDLDTGTQRKLMDDPDAAILREGREHRWEECQIRSADRSILTVSFLESSGMVLWRNGEEGKLIAYPEADDMESEMPFSLQIGRNGRIAVFFQKNELEMRVAIYDTWTGKWQWIQDVFHPIIIRNHSYCIGNDQPYFAVTEVEDVIRFYDTDTGREIGRFDCSLPFGSFRDMQFIKDDEYLLIGTNDFRFRIVDARTGEEVYASNDTFWRCAEDPERDRLYLYGDGAGVCVSTRSWEEIAQIPGMESFDAPSNRIVRSVQDDDGTQLVAITIPDTPELIDACRELFRIKD